MRLESRLEHLVPAAGLRVPKGHRHDLSPLFSVRLGCRRFDLVLRVKRLEDPVEKRIIDAKAEPFDSRPLMEGFCPVCDQPSNVFQQNHLVGRGQGGDDLDVNLFWSCRACNDKLPPQGLANTDECIRLVVYARHTVPELGQYADGKKWPGWLEERYLGYGSRSGIG